MITDQFLNICAYVITSESKTVGFPVIEDIKSILKSQNVKDIPLSFQKKFQLIDTWCDMKIQNFKIMRSKLIDEVQSTGFFNDYSDYINAVANSENDEQKLHKCITYVMEKKFLLNVYSNSSKIEEFLTKVKNNQFTTSSEVSAQWGTLIRGVHHDIVKQVRQENLQSVCELDLEEDDYTHVCNQIEKSYSGTDNVPTGYPILDGHMNGGFAPRRLYIFAGTSGSGKSVFLINFVKNAVEKLKVDSTSDDIPTIVYVTLENLIDETLLRLYCNLTNQKVTKVISNFESERSNIETTIKEWLRKYRVKVKFIYRKPGITSMADIVAYCDELKAQNPNISIKGLYIDYMDLLKSGGGTSYDQYRLEMGQVAVEMKMGSVMLDTPCISVSQLNRSAYNKSNKLGLDNMSEAMKKVDNADFVALFQQEDQEQEKTGSVKEQSDEGYVVMNIEKNRSGPKNRSVTFKTNFSIFSIEEKGNGELMTIDSYLDKNDTHLPSKNVIAGFDIVGLDI